MRRFLKRLALISLVTLLVAQSSSLPVSAQWVTDPSLRTGTVMYDPNFEDVCDPSSASRTITPTRPGEVGDVPGLAAAIEGAKQHAAVYDKVGKKVGVPPEMIAVLHYRESAYRTENPGNGQGIYQFVNGDGGPYPAGPVSAAEFERQTEFAATRLKTRYSSTDVASLANVELDYEGSNAQKVKDVFFSYNGRALVYKLQAEKLGFNMETEPFEGSPYVMNYADDRRNPEKNTTTWGQIKSDFGAIEYPANKQIGAFVLYQALGGNLPTSCASTGASGIVGVAERELAKNISENPPGCDAGNPSSVGSCGFEIDKYTDNHLEYWCADFVSWVYKEAGKPFTGGASGGWRIASVSAMQAWFMVKGGYFSKDSGKTPQPGDVVFFQNNQSHVGIVVAVNGDTISTIEGNTSTDFTNNGNGVGSHQYNYKTYPALSGFGRMP